MRTCDRLSRWMAWVRQSQIRQRCTNQSPAVLKCTRHGCSLLIRTNSTVPAPYTAKYKTISLPQYCIIRYYVTINITSLKKASCRSELEKPSASKSTGSMLDPSMVMDTLRHLHVRSMFNYKRPWKTHKHKSMLILVLSKPRPWINVVPLR